MKSYGCAVYAHGIELHGDGRRRKRGPLGWLYLRPPLARGRGPRGAIRGFSVRSRQRLAWALANAGPEFRTHLTLTYHARVDEADADAAAERNRSLISRAKRDLNRFLACLRREAGRYCWIQELYSRGTGREAGASGHSLQSAYVVEPSPFTRHTRNMEGLSVVRHPAES